MTCGREQKIGRENPSAVSHAAGASAACALANALIVHVLGRGVSCAIVCALRFSTFISKMSGGDNKSGAAAAGGGASTGSAAGSGGSGSGSGGSGGNAQEPKLAIIGGSSFLESKYFASFEPFVVDTPYGKTKLRRGAIRNVIFVQRHSASTERNYTPPHLLNPRAVIHALKELVCVIPLRSD